MKRDSRGRFVAESVSKDAFCRYTLECTEDGNNCPYCANRRKKSYYTPEKPNIYPSTWPYPENMVWMTWYKSDVKG